MSSTFVSAGEALALGLATGPVCLASCGPVVVPWLLVQPGGVRTNSRGLSLFLAARLAGYLLFAGAAWWAGSLLPLEGVRRPWVFGCVQLLLAAALMAYALGWPHRERGSAHNASGLVRIGEVPATPRAGAVALGFLTGVSLCPPFLVAGVRAAQSASLPAALFFFTVFFAGTAIWFLPFLALGLVPRTPALLLVARITAILLGCYYGFLGTTTLLLRVTHV